MRRIYKIAIVALVFFHLIGTLTKLDLSVPIFISAVVIGICGIPLIGKSFRKVAVVFLLLGLLLLLCYRQPFSIWLMSFNYMTNLISVLVVMQLFTIPIAAGKYDLAIGHLLQKSCKGTGKLFIVIMLVTNVFSSFLSMGTVPLVITLIEETAKSKVSDYKRLIATAVSRGFSLGTLWAPGAATIYLVGQVSGVGWSMIFLPGVFLALLGIAVSYLLELKRHRISDEITQPEPRANRLSSSEERQLIMKVWHIAGAVISLVTSSMLFVQLKIGSSGTAVILSGVIVFLVWMTFIRKEPQLRSGLKNYWDKALLKAADLAPFFIAIGVFSGAFQHSGMAGYLELSLKGFVHGLGNFAIILVPLTLVLLALVGLHPFISIVLLGQILMALQLPLPTVTLALCLTLGSSIAYMVSPFAGIIMTIANFIDARATDVAIRWNWRFCAIYFVLGIALAYTLGKFLL